MKFNILTIFPEMFTSFLSSSLMEKGIDKGILDVELYNFRDYTLDKHKKVDDAPFGGGAGMLIGPQSVIDCFSDIREKQHGKKVLSIYMSPAGKLLDQSLVKELSGYDELNILCGHYEGVDQRIIDAEIDMEVSVGDYILTGGELPSMIVVDAVSRYVPSFLGNGESPENESFSYHGLLEYPQYTRPSDFRGMKVPKVLLSGHHKNIEEYQRQQAIIKTFKNRPDLLEKADLSGKDREFLENYLSSDESRC